MRFTEQFMDTCFSFEEGNKLRYAFGAALYHAEEIMGKVIVLYGDPGTGKSSILEPFQSFSGDRKIWVYHDFDLKRIDRLWIGNDEVVFAATNRLPEEELPDYVEVIRTSGNRIPLEDWKKFKQEMWYCPEEFFRSCMTCYVMEHKEPHTNQIDEYDNDPLPKDFLSYLYANYGLSTRARNALARADLTSYSAISNFVQSGKNTNEWSKYANQNKYGIRNFGEECYKELVRIFNEFKNNHKSIGD